MFVLGDWLCLMAAARKLQASVDATLRRIEEGIDEFHVVWRKCEEAANPNQRDKTQNDLKREIKKLQRLREEIMKFVSNNDVKDKQPLLEFRRKIELEMERFKTFEREQKTKPFSFQGLQMSEKIDPEEERRQLLRDTIDETLQAVQVSLDSYHADIEPLTGKKKKSKEDLARIEQLKVCIERHGFHIMNLEIVLRRLDNVDPDINLDDVEAVGDHVEQFLSNHQDEDYFHDDTIYDSLAEGAVAINESYFVPQIAGDEKVEEEEGSLEKKQIPSASVPVKPVSSSKPTKKDGTAQPVCPSIAPPAPQRPSPPKSSPPPLPDTSSPPSRPVPPAPVSRSPKNIRAPSRTSSPEKPAPTWAGIASGGVTSTSSSSAVASSALMKAFLSSFEGKPRLEDTILKPKKVAPTHGVTSPFGADVCHFADQESSYRKLTPETLLFAFYYRQNTYAQLLAAKELKRQGWRYHKKINQWFKRQDEPKLTTSDYEHGAYLTLDPKEAEWRIRVRPEFTFEYALVEDYLLD
jgi:CCR4-NOT transcription complex subunit 3